jgi:hypothetical protein
MNPRENLMRAVRFESPEHIPMTFHINPACWQSYPQDVLQALMADHPFLFPGFEKTEEKIIPEFPYVARAKEPFVDDWGCLWETKQDGITGTVTKHPLQSWDAFENYTPPDPDTCSGIGPYDWSQATEDLRRAKREGRMPMGTLRHGHTFLQLCDIRGYENLIYDMADKDPRLFDLMKMIEAFNLEIVRRYIALGAEWMSYPEDLGMQRGPLLSPNQFRLFIKPSYQRLMAPAREAGCIIHMHSDGDIRDLAEDLLDLGLDVINIQDRVNTIDWIRNHLKGRVCVELDIDRQRVTLAGTPREIDDLIRKEVEELGSREGGLMMIYGLYPGLPLENIKALMDAMERYAFYFS